MLDNVLEKELYAILFGCKWKRFLWQIPSLHNPSEGMDMQIHTVYKSLRVSDAELQQIRVEPESDSQRVQLVQVILDGWRKEKMPRRHQWLLKFLRWTVLDKRDHSQRWEDLLPHIHVGHMGIGKSKSSRCVTLARDVWTDRTNGWEMWYLPGATLFRHQGAHDFSQNTNPH